MLARQLVRSALTKLREGHLVVNEDGRTARYGPGGQPTATITVHDRRFWSAVARRGSVGLGDAYAEGWFDCDDLAALIHLAVVNLEPLRGACDGLVTTVAPVRDRLPTRSRGRETDRRHVAAHYDLSNDLFSLMLDSTMAYSCALFDEPNTTLELAQIAKFDRICELIDLQPDDHLLEIGTGWGGFACYAASTRGCRVTTTTISNEQYDHARKRVVEEGLADRIDVLDLDYRDLCGTYDKVVSIEMIEAVDWRDHPSFFSSVADRLRPGGRALLQAIVIDDRSYERAKRHTDFVKATIFPGGCLPSIESILTHARATGSLVALDVSRIGEHYPETLRRWKANVDTFRDEVRRLGFDERFLRTWDFYLEYCAGSFESGHIDTAHVVLGRV